MKRQFIVALTAGMMTLTLAAPAAEAQPYAKSYQKEDGWCWVQYGPTGANMKRDDAKRIARNHRSNGGAFANTSSLKPATTPTGEGERAIKACALGIDYETPKAEDYPKKVGIIAGVSIAAVVLAALGAFLQGQLPL